jgi:hypothetical protein
MAGAEQSRVALPPRVAFPIEVYVNGVLQEEGRDFELDGRTLVFDRSLAREAPLGFWRWTRMFLGIAGSYGRNDTVDVVYRSGGRRVVATGLAIESEPR